MAGKMAKGLLWVVASGVMFMGSAAWGGQVFSHFWGGVKFETPVAFSKPAKVGLGAAALISPPGSALGKGGLEITLVQVPKDMWLSLGGKPAEVMRYVKATYLGTAKPAQARRERTFMGSVVKGEVQQVSIPRPAELQVYLVPLAGGDWMAVALCRDRKTPAAQADRVMDMLSKTIKQIPKR